MVDHDGDEAVDMYINSLSSAVGTLAVNGQITGAGGIQINLAANGLPLGTVELNSANTFGGSVRGGRGNIVLGNDDSLGTGTYRQQGPANQFGYNLISTDDARNLDNNIVIAQWQTVKGDHSLELSGSISQTNNRGLINLLPEGKELVLSGRVNIWEDEEELERRFVVDGTGLTKMTGEIKNDPLDVGVIEPLREVVKDGTGTLLIDVAANSNNHQGAEVVQMGYLRYASNDALNVNLDASIRAIGGAVGVDQHPTGQNLGTNTAFLDLIEPTSTGGLMLSPSDAATNLDFTSGSLANAGNMSVAASCCRDYLHRNNHSCRQHLQIGGRFRNAHIAKRSTHGFEFAGSEKWRRGPANGRQLLHGFDQCDFEILFDAGVAS